MIKSAVIKKSIRLLEYSLSKKGIDSKNYLIALSGEDKPDLDMQYCLRERVDDYWEVYYSERGIKSSSVVFTGYRDAIKYFYWQLTKAKDPWDYREEWEKATGKEF